MHLRKVGDFKVASGVLDDSADDNEYETELRKKALLSIV